MTDGALHSIVIGWGDGRVAADAVGEAGVVEGHIRPAGDIVTQRAVAWVMIFWRRVCMANQAFSKCSMVEGNIRPGCGVVTERAL